MSLKVPLLIITVLLPACLLAETSAATTGNLQGQPWPLHIIDSTSTGADGVRLGDINRDGLPDIATGWEEGGLVRIYIHPGHAAAAQPWPPATVGAVDDVEDAVFVDLDGDGTLEVISSCEGGNRAIYFHSLRGENPLDESAWSTVTLSESDDLMQWMFCAPITLDPQDGVSIVAAGKSDNAAIGLFTRDQSDNWRWSPLAGAGWVMSIRVLDMNGDSRPDILYSDRYGNMRGVRWLENPGRVGAQWPNHLIGGGEYEVLFLDSGDLDGDGQLEIAIAAKPARILVFDRGTDGWEMSELSYPEGTGRAKAVAIADFDLDGRMDLVASCEGANDCSGVFWLRVDKWPEPANVEYFDIAGTRGIKFDRIECIDIDGDGDRDVLTTDERDGLGVIWYENPQL